MSERRTIRSAPTRVEFQYESIYGSVDTTGPFFVCLTQSDIYMITRLLYYAKRRINWVFDAIPDSGWYNGLLDNEYETVLTAIERMEDSLMTGLCVDDVVAAIEAQTAVLQQVADCVCAASAVQTSSQQDASAVVDGGKIYEPSLFAELAIAGTPVPATDTEVCNLANVIWGFAFEFITEKLIPATELAIDATSVAIAASSAFAVFTGGIGLPAAAAASLLAAFVSFITNGVVEDLLNWMYGNGQEIVCSLYTGMLVDGFDGAASFAEQYIEASSLSPTEKIVLQLFLTSQYYMQAIEYQIGQGDLNPTPYILYPCTGCETPYDYQYIGRPCASATLIGVCGPNDCIRVNVPNDVTTPLFNLDSVGDYVITYRIQYPTLTSTIEMRLRQAGGTVVDTWQTTLNIGENKLVAETATITIPGDHYLEWTNVGAADGDLVFATITKL